MVQQDKIQVVEQTAERLARSQAVVVVQYSGLTVKDMQDLRRQLREAGSELKVVKNRLVKRALADKGFAPLDDILIGPTALAFGYDDPTGPPKVCTKFAKDNEKMKVLGGLLGKERLDGAKIIALSKMPSRPELLAQMAGALLAPARQMATALKQAMTKIVYAMKARAEQMSA